MPLPEVDRLIAIGSDRMMAAVQAARHGILAPHLKDSHAAVPATGKETIIFSCFNQDQDMDRVDFPNLAARLRQNTVQEKLSTQWLDHLLAGQSVPHV